MQRTARTLIMELIVCTSLLAIAPRIPQAQADFAGTICIAPTTTITCPTMPATFTSKKGQTLGVAVNVKLSNFIDTADLMILANKTVLEGVSVDLNNTLLSSGYFKTLCINGLHIYGPSPCSPRDGPGVVHVRVETFLIQAPVTGRLFTITYNVESVSNATIGFQTGCINTSSPDNCVSISDGGLLHPENLQTATFGRSQPFQASSSPASLSLYQGATDTVKITLAGLNFTGNVLISATVLPTVANSTIISLVPSVLNLSSPFQIVNSTMTIQARRQTPTQGYVIGVTLTSGALFQNLAIPLTVLPPPPPDFTMSASPSSIYVINGQYGHVNITVTGIYNFSGQVTLQLDTGGFSFLTPSSVTLPPNGTAIVVLTIGTNPQSSGSAGDFIIIGYSGTIVHYLHVFVQIGPPPPDFTVSSHLSFLTVHAGESTSATITVTTNINQITVALKTVVSPFVTSGPITVTTTNSLQIQWWKSWQNSTTLTVYTSTSTPLGNYSVIITGSGGGPQGFLNHTIAITLIVYPSLPPPSAPATPPSIPLSLITWLRNGIPTVKLVSLVIIIAVGLIGVALVAKSWKRKT